MRSVNKNPRWAVYESRAVWITSPVCLLLPGWGWVRDVIRRGERASGWVIIICFFPQPNEQGRGELTLNTVILRCHNSISQYFDSRRGLTLANMHCVVLISKWCITLSIALQSRHSDVTHTPDSRWCKFYFGSVCDILSKCFSRAAHWIPFLHHRLLLLAKLIKKYRWRWLMCIYCSWAIMC